MNISEKLQVIGEAIKLKKINCVKFYNETLAPNVNIPFNFRGEKFIIFGVHMHRIKWVL